jgi:hypothetical protein
VLGLIRPNATAPAVVWPVTTAWPNRPRGPVLLAQPTANSSLAGPCHAARAQCGHLAQSGRRGVTVGGGMVASVVHSRRREHRRQGAKLPGKVEGGSHLRRSTTVRCRGATGVAAARGDVSSPVDGSGSGEFLKRGEREERVRN